MAWWQVRRWRLIYPVVLFILLFFDGTLMANFGGVLASFPWHILPNLTLIWLFYGIQFDLYEGIPYFWYVAGTGLLFDMYYTGIIGTYLVAYLFATLIMRNMSVNLSKTVFSGVATLFVGQTAYFIIVYLAGMVLKQVNVSVLNYLLYTILPSLLFNLGIALLFYFFVWRLTQLLDI